MQSNAHAKTIDIIVFHFLPSNNKRDSCIYVIVTPGVSESDIAEIEDCVASYLESVETWYRADLVQDVMNSFSNISYQMMPYLYDEIKSRTNGRFHIIDI